jgi:hypothetical protein
VSVPNSTRVERSVQQFTATFDCQKLPRVTKSFAITLVSSVRVGNLLKKSGFEELDRDGKTPMHWRGINARVISSRGLGLGLGKNVLKFSNAVQYAHYGQAVSLPRAATRWDAGSLYVALEASDNVHYPAGDGESVVTGDSVILAFDPSGRSPDPSSRSSALYLSAQKPAGGSGTHTLWRPRLHSAERPEGHLARDSSVYELAIKVEAGICVYEMRIPWNELGVNGILGAKLGFGVQSNDNDGQELAAQMNWGGGLAPSWRPAAFGIVTLVE